MQPVFVLNSWKFSEEPEIPGKTLHRHHLPIQHLGQSSLGTVFPCFFVNLLLIFFYFFFLTFFRSLFQCFIQPADIFSRAFIFPASQLFLSAAATSASSSCPTHIGSTRPVFSSTSSVWTSIAAWARSETPPGESGNQRPPVLPYIVPEVQAPRTLRLDFLFSRQSL